MAATTKEITEQDILNDIHAYCDKFTTKKFAADSFGVSRVFLWKVLEGKVPPTTGMLDKLGYKRERIITYKYTRSK